MRNLILAIMTLCAVCACKSQYEMLLNSNDVESKYEAAFMYFNSGKYAKAASLFESLSILTDGTERDDTVKYYWGLSNYKAKDYYTADANFESFVESYPRSPFAQEARYLRLDCLFMQTLRYELDQTPTYKALDAIYEFIRDYPDDANVANCRSMSEDLEERLDRKAYEAAKLYYTIEDYRAATYALKLVIKEDADNIYREDIMYYVVLSSYKYALNSVSEKQRERYMDFADEYFTFVTEFPESSYRRELDALSNKVNKILERK